MSSSAPDVRQRIPSWAQVTAEREQHIGHVAALLTEWAEAMAVGAAERDRWLRAAYLHDALKDAPPDELKELAGPDWAERKIRHGPAAARRAASDGESDRGVLDAVRYHSIGCAAWDRVGRMLYLADYLEPRRRYLSGQHDAWRRRVPDDPDTVLREVALHRITTSLAAGHPLLPATVAFWNSLV